MYVFVYVYAYIPRIMKLPVFLSARVWVVPAYVVSPLASGIC